MDSDERASYVSKKTLSKKLDSEMNPVEKRVLENIFNSTGLSRTKLGLRFDRVALRLIDELRNHVASEISLQRTVIVTVSAPIRLPGETAEKLKQKISLLASSENQFVEIKSQMNGNRVRIKLIERHSRRSPQFIGLVHNQTSSAAEILNLVETQMRHQDI